jgi:hypothetical protein
LTPVLADYPYRGPCTTVDGDNDLTASVSREGDGDHDRTVTVSEGRARYVEAVVDRVSGPVLDRNLSSLRRTRNG